MLLFFILYEMQKMRNSQWYLMIKNLPKDLDYVVFWSDKEILDLEDKSLIKLAKKSRDEFELEYQETVKIMKKYPNLFASDCYSYNNVKWIYTHLITR